MALPLVSFDQSASRLIHRSQDIATSAHTAFALICEVEKWPVWLSFFRSARRIDPTHRLGIGAEIAVRSTIPGDAEELYEVDAFLEGHLLSLVGAYSVRRRIDFRIESKTERSKIVVRIDYPTYGGVLGALIDRMTSRRKLDVALADALTHFKGLAEYERNPETVLEDF
jgi:uncharacterized membrane protein